MLKKLRETDLPILHTLIYSSEKPRWILYNAPYFDEYKQLNLETFLKSDIHLFFWVKMSSELFMKKELLELLRAIGKTLGLDG